jgi:GGDEF domain-containing protein
MVEPSDIFVLAPEGEVRRRILAALPGAVAHAAPLEALAELAAAEARGRKVFVTTPAALQYRYREILRAVRGDPSQPAVYLVCSTEEEPQAAEMAAAGADDYFLAPAGLADLARAVAAVDQRPTIPLPHRLGDSRGPVLRLSAREAATEELRTAARECLRQLALLATKGAAEIAAGGVECLLGIKLLTGAALLGADEPPLQLAAAGEDGDWTADLDASAATDSWIPSGQGQWLYASSAIADPRLALAVRTRDESLSEELADELATYAQTFVAIYWAAREREAALRVLSTDAETGLASRRYFDHFLKALCRRATERRHEIALALFSPVGGAALARTALAPLAALLRESFAGTKLARVGETQLAAILTGADAGADVLAGRLQDFAAKVGQAGLPAPVALAAATFPWQATDATSLLRAAQTNLEASRRNGFVPVLS